MVELNKILHADCMDIMRDIPDKYFELAVVDPPYGIGFDNGIVTSEYRGVKQKNGRKLIVKQSQYYGKTWDKVPDEKYFEELFRISKNQIIWGANHFISKIPIDSSAWIVWDKCNIGTHQSDAELAWTSFNKAVRLFPYMWSGMMQGESAGNGRKMQGNKKLNESRIHPTQKPIALYRWLLINYAKPGDKIIDTHSGSASCAIACHLEKFDFLAIEKDEDYYKASLKRYNEEVSQGKLF